MIDISSRQASPSKKVGNVGSRARRTVVSAGRPMGLGGEKEGVEGTDPI